MERLGIIIQARTGSNRLPNKVIRPFYKEQTIIDVIIEKLKLEFYNNSIVLATTKTERDSVLVERAIHHNIKYFQGSEDDVLQRFVQTAEKFNFEKIIRVCADNPFLDVSAIYDLSKEFSNSKSDYISFEINGVPSIRTHYGLWAEGVSLNALKKILEHTNEKFYHEHVTNYIYNHPDLFDLKLIKIDTETLDENIRLTIDTEEDFNLMKKIYSFMKKNKICDTETIISIISKNRDWLENMKKQIDLNSK